MPTFAGRCHCGNLETTLQTGSAAADLPLRSCACTFCRRHGSRTAADARGNATIKSKDGALLSRYRFGLGLAEMIVCARCGCYAGAVMEHEGKFVSALNVNLFDDPAFAGRAGDSVSYDGETAEARRARRLKLWTPTTWAGSK